MIETITLQCLLEFESEGDRQKVLFLMRRWSSAMRYAYQRLIEGQERKELKRHISKVIFGERAPFEQPFENHFKSGESEQADRKPVNRRKERVRDRSKDLLKSLRVLSVAFGVLLLSPLRRVLVSGDWGQASERLAPVLGAGAMASQRPPAGAGLPEEAGYKYPSPSCVSLIQFG